MNNFQNNFQGFQVAPHGIILLGALAILLVLLINALGFRVVGAIRVGR